MSPLIFIQNHKKNINTIDYFAENLLVTLTKLFDKNFSLEALGFSSAIICISMQYIAVDISDIKTQLNHSIFNS
nr:hypothetical protein [Prochlorococcus marinus]